MSLGIKNTYITSLMTFLLAFSSRAHFFNPFFLFGEKFLLTFFSGAEKTRKTIFIGQMKVTITNK